MAADPFAAFLDAMERAGVRPVEPLLQQLGPSICRFRCEGDGQGKRNGWAIIYADGRPAGAFGNYRLGIKERWSLTGCVGLNPADLANWRRDVAQRQTQRQADRIALQNKVAVDSAALWERAAAALPSHPYVERKGVGVEGVKQDGKALLIPMRDGAGKLWNVQRIFPDGFKQFGAGGRIEGLYWSAGKVRDRLAVGEGFATMAAVRKATGLPVAAAFTSANLMAVAKLLRGKFPDVAIIMAADDDIGLVDHPKIKKNVGVVAATAAAQAVGGFVAMPPSGS